MRIWKSETLFFLAMLAAITLCGSRASADFAKRLSYQGRLTNSDGVPLASGSYSMTFKLYTVETGGAAIWTEDHTGGNAVSVDNGLFSTVLGGISTLNSINFNGTEYWIEVVVGATTYSPRQRLTAAPFALNVPDGLITSTKMADGAALAEIVDDDGAGSGLDCDLLDGYDWSSFPAFADVWVNVSGDTMSGTLDMDNNAIIDIDWANSDDGPGSGLDADLLDGLQGADYQRRVSSSCAAGSSIRAIAADGTVTCETDDDTTAHGSLSGLGNDDHTQYFHLSQNETVSGIPAFNGGTTGSSAPFSVDSTFLVTNLNADLLDGLHASSFMSASTDLWVNVTGDTMTGNLSIDYAGNPGIELRGNSGGTPYIDWSNDAASDYDARMILTGDDRLELHGASFLIYEGNDAAEAKLDVYGANQGTGRVYVGQSSTYGGGMIYNGDGTPASNTTTDNISFFRRNAGTDTEVMRYSYDNSTVYFNSNIRVGDSSNADDDFVYFDAGGESIQWDDAGSNGHRFRVSDDMDVAGTISAAAPAFYQIQNVTGPSHTVDNAWHTVQCSAGYAISNITVWASNYLDGFLSLNCYYVGDLLDTSTESWTGDTGTCDNFWHVATCPGGYIARGIEVYATGRLDYRMKLLCTKLATGVSYNDFSYNVLSGDNTCDDCYHGVSCPPGTYAYSVQVWAASYLDTNLSLNCRGFKP